MDSFIVETMREVVGFDTVFVMNVTVALHEIVNSDVLVLANCPGCLECFGTVVVLSALKLPRHLHQA